MLARLVGGMACPECGGDVLVFPVASGLWRYLPDDREAAAVCTHCLYVTPEDDAPDELPDFTTISDAFPRDREAAATLALVLALAESIVHYREELDGLLELVEAAGVDAMLALDRLAADPDLDPYLDLERRNRQLEQLVS